MWGRLVAPGNQAEKLWGRGLKGSEGAQVIPSSGGPPSTRDLLHLTARAGGAAWNPQFLVSGEVVWVLRVLVLSLPGRRKLGSPPLPESEGWLGPSPPLCHVALWGPGRVRGVGGLSTGPAIPGSVLRGPAGDLHRGACPAPARGDKGWLLGGGREWGSRTRGPGYAALPPPVYAGSSLPRPRGVAKFQSAARTFEKGTFCFRP